MPEPLLQTSTTTDINADTAHSGHVAKALGKSGQEDNDEEDLRRDQLKDKSRTTQPASPTPVEEGTDYKTGGPNYMAKYSAQQLRQMVARGQAMRNASGEPSYPIGDPEDLSKAINAVGRSGTDHDAVRKHIIRRARAMGKQNSIPSGWSSDGSLKSVAAEAPLLFAPILRLEGTVPGAIVLQEASEENGGQMRVRVPFYVGESVSRAPGFQDKIYFPGSLLPGVVQEGKAQLAEGRQPLTVYARHAHATSGDHLPVGKVVDLEQEGRIGYAVLEIAPTGTGRDIQALVKASHLNAVSLRSGPGRFELERKKVNGEPMLQAARLAIDGIDFAPDSPAMPTYGVEVLAAEARVEPNPTPKRRQPPVSDPELTLDTLRTEYPELVAELEAPIQRELAKMTSERNVLQAEKTARQRDEKLRDIASKFPEPEKALPVLQELCAECETDAQVAEKAFPVLLEALDRARNSGKEITVERPAKEVLLEMFRPGGAGQVLQQEPAPNPDHIDPATLTGIDLAEV